MIWIVYISFFWWAIKAFVYIDWRVWYWIIPTRPKNAPDSGFVLNVDLLTDHPSSRKENIAQQQNNQCRKLALKFLLLRSFRPIYPCIFYMKMMTTLLKKMGQLVKGPLESRLKILTNSRHNAGNWKRDLTRTRSFAQYKYNGFLPRSEITFFENGMWNGFHVYYFSKCLSEFSTETWKITS